MIAGMWLALTKAGADKFIREMITLKGKKFETTQYQTTHSICAKPKT